MVFEENGSDLFSSFPSNLRMKKEKVKLTAPLQTAQSNLVETDDITILRIHQFRPAWSVQAYVRFSRMPHSVLNSSYPIKEPTGYLPQLQDGHFLVPSDSALSHLQRVHHDLDETLSEVEKTDAMTYSSLISDKLQVILDFFQYIEDESYQKTTIPLLKQTIPFPLNKIFATYAQYKTKIKLQSHNMGHHNVEEMLKLASYLYEKVEKKMDTEGPYFFGNEPSTLDAHLFGHLADATNNMQLSSILSKFKKLCTYFKYICNKHFMGEYDSLSPAMSAIFLRSDYVNSKNKFNQLEQSFLTTLSVNYAPELFGHTPRENLDQCNNMQAEPIRTENQSIMDIENRRWYTAIASSLAAYLLFRCDFLGFIVDGSDDDDDDDDEH